MKQFLPLICILLLNQSCINKTGDAIDNNALNVKSFMGFWQNTENPHNFIVMSVASDGQGMWGSFPLEPDSLNPAVADTAAYYRNFCFMGAFNVEQNKITCWYQDMDKQGVHINGEIQLIEKDVIKTPVGSFRKLSNEEVAKINPHI